MSSTNTKAPNSNINYMHIAEPSGNEQRSFKIPIAGTTFVNNQPTILVEVDTLKQIRIRTFSHWPHQSSPSKSQMIQAGFFSCNVDDRVICIYCNIICQQWTPDTDDPCETHKILSPNCSYVIAMVTRSQILSPLVINEHTNTDHPSTSYNNDPFQSHVIVHTAARNIAYIQIPKRYASFATWPTDNLPSVDDLVKAGFFYTGTNTIVRCFYCNGSLEKWCANDNPTIEHARWFPQCAYAKQLCGSELYRRIQESKRAEEELTQNDSGDGLITNRNVPSSGQLSILDESTLSRLVNARLDLPISQRLLDRHFKVSVIKRCWEDQLRIKNDDFVEDCDLSMACTILQKQIDYIDGKKENITVPSVAMNRIREAEQRASGSSSTHMLEGDDVSLVTSSSESSSNGATSSFSNMIKEKSHENVSTIRDSSDANKSNTSTPTNPCVLCLEEEKRLACIPCGHMATCVSCGHSLRSCPICRRTIDAFVRIYL